MSHSSPDIDNGFPEPAIEAVDTADFYHVIDDGNNTEGYPLNEESSVAAVTENSRARVQSATQEEEAR